MDARLCALGLVVTLPACAWGFRGGPEVLAGTRGGSIVQGSVTGAAGFGSTHRDRTVSDGVVATLNLAAGASTAGGEALSIAAGLSWFRFDEVGRLGWTVGAETGVRYRGAGLPGVGLLVGLRGGPHVRLLSRAATGERLVTLAFDLVLQGQLPLEESRSDGAFVAGLSVTIGFMNVRFFHL